MGIDKIVLCWLMERDSISWKNHLEQSENIFHWILEWYQRLFSSIWSGIKSAVVTIWKGIVSVGKMSGMV